jgi:hypothetical protein
MNGGPWPRPSDIGEGTQLLRMLQAGYPRPVAHPRTVHTTTAARGAR